MTEVMTETELQQLAERGAAELEGAGADELLRWTDENFGGNYIVASNMQDAVLVDLAAKVRPGVDVLFLDTGYHFVETIGTRDAVEAVYDINVVNVTPENSVAKQDELFGKDLFAREPNECCRMRKVEPLGKALQGYSAWVTGIRRVEAPTRANAPLISWDKAFNLVKINPIAA
ncbi:MAG: phosphoadenosine phosphosulfate reductase, partial [Pseudonocardiales bacterium]|nr:phosphoadenosine phosphosulfate reductase [Pseudonocardiales bacterium]